MHGLGIDVEALRAILKNILVLNIISCNTISMLYGGIVIKFLFAHWH